MPTLRTYLPKGQPRLHSVNKPITTIGSSPSNDIVVQADGVAEAHAQIIFDGRFFNLEEVDRAADIQINGKKKRRARLSHNDRIHLGSAEIAFSLLGDPSFVLATEQETSSNTTDIAGLEQLNAFSERLMQRGASTNC
ncbi:MAG TPA: FHA domain-containing protein [Polyangiaceae bacterium]|nr:FHA domain-containing protein [Polyangiaceae bacterium]